MVANKYSEKTYTKYENVIKTISRLIFREITVPEKVYMLETTKHLRIPPSKENMTEIVPGTAWGSEYSNMWLKCEITVPACAEGEVLCAVPNANAVEILCFKNGKPAGIINSKNQFIGGDHSVMFVSPCAHAGENIELDFECYAGHKAFGEAPMAQYDDDIPVGDVRHVYEDLRILLLDKTIRDFVFDISVLLQLARLPEDNFISMKAHEALMDAFPYLLQDVKTASLEEIRESCRKVSEIAAPALKKDRADVSRGRLKIIGHSHMDTAWLWPVSETVRKCARTYSQALTLMDMYPEYTFTQSSILHLDWMKTYYPDIFEKIKERVAEGRYEINGGVWVECDCNITSGESMIRQFLYGQRYVEKNLGFKMDSFWLPDTFGYNAAIPQIMLGCGVKYFYTTKIGWNDMNSFPIDTFRWRGLDGSEVITHFNATHLMPDVNTLFGYRDYIKDKHSTDTKLIAYGFGDGGGGPTYGMLELLRRETDLPGMPEIKPATQSSFMHELELRRDKLPLFEGELYLEFHRGTLTQMHEVKKNNRTAEVALHNMELLNVLCDEKINEKHDEFYKILLKNQFHDILPGTSITKVYETAIPEMRKLIDNVNAETDAYADKLTTANNGKISIFNPLSFARNDIVTLSGEIHLDNKTSQTYTDIDGNVKTDIKVHIPAMSAEVLTKAEPISQPSRFTANGNSLITPFYKVEFDENGYISYLYDIHRRRQINREGSYSLGTLWFGEDFPTLFDNWEIEYDAFHKLHPVCDLISREVVSDGAIEYRIRTKYKFGRKSSITLDTVFYAGCRRIDFTAKVDWNERHSLLKAGFDVNIHSAFVKNEIQFGHVERPTTRNNSLEEAKFEVCNHKWSDLSESRYGIAILNNCKYGISVEGSNMMLTLHRGGCRPDPYTDNGVHYMTYSLLPHENAFSAENVVYPAYELNYPAIVKSGEMSAEKLFETDAPNIICEAVKNSEDTDGTYVLRLYECERNATNCILNLYGAERAWEANMLEEKTEELEINHRKVELKFRPFEIKTIIVEKQKDQEKD